MQCCYMHDTCIKGTFLPDCRPSRQQAKPCISAAGKMDYQMECVFFDGTLPLSNAICVNSQGKRKQQALSLRAHAKRIT